MVVVCSIVRRHDTQLEPALILHHRMIQTNADISMYRHALLQSVYNDCRTLRRLVIVPFSKEWAANSYESKSCNGRFSVNTLRSSNICVASVMRRAMYSCGVSLPSSSSR